MMKVRLAVVAGMLVVAVPGASHAQGFFEALFGAIGGAARAPARAIQHQQPLIFGDERPEPRVSRRDTTSGGGGGAFCVRSCDGRYFPVPASGGQSRADVCNSFCPAGDAEVYYGSSIDHARGPEGRPYTALKYAFRFRNEIVSGCTCNGKDSVGLARIDINEDPTLRKGDIVASGNGLMVATGRITREGAGLSEMPASVRASFAKLPVVAKD